VVKGQKLGGVESVVWFGVGDCGQYKGTRRDELLPQKQREGEVFYSTTNEMHPFLKFILFCNSTLHVKVGLSVHLQESKAVHTASGICTALDS